MISLPDTFSILVNSVSKISAKNFVKKCHNIGMIPKPYFDTGLDNNLPEFDKGYNLIFNTDDNVIARLEVLEKDEKILQAGIQIIYSSSFFFSRINKHFTTLKSICDNYYGLCLPMDMGNIKILNYGDADTVSYISKMKVSGKKILTFRVGNKKIVDLTF